MLFLYFFQLLCLTEELKNAASQILHLLSINNSNKTLIKKVNIPQCDVNVYFYIKSEAKKATQQSSLQQEGDASV